MSESSDQTTPSTSAGNDVAVGSRGWRARIRGWLHTLMRGPATAGGDDPPADPILTFNDLTVVSSGWITRRESCPVADLDVDGLAEMEGLLSSAADELRASLAGVYRVELRWRRCGRAALAWFVAGDSLASVNALLTGLRQEDDEAAVHGLCDEITAVTGRPVRVVGELGEPPLMITMRFPNAVARSGEYDLESMRRHLAGAFFLRTRHRARP